MHVTRISARDCRGNSLVMRADHGSNRHVLFLITRVLRQTALVPPIHSPSEGISRPEL
jgi:hypothetical protein